jgi:enoyl-CoA hydratase
VSDDRVLYEIDGRIGRITMNRPAVKNAQSGPLLRDLDAAFTRAVEDRTVRVIVLGGRGDSFSAGHDLGTDEQVAEREARPKGGTSVEDAFSYSWDHFLQMSRRWRDLPKPTIAMVHGWCIYGGWLVASAMDFIVAADDARFLTNLLQYFTLPFDVAPRKAKELLFDGHVITAAEAHELGFVNRVVARDRLQEEVLAQAHRIAEQPGFLLRAMKLAVNNAQDAMGFHAAVQAAHSHYQLSEASSKEVRRRRTGSDDPPRSLVRDVVARESEAKQSEAKQSEADRQGT